MSGKEGVGVIASDREGDILASAPPYTDEGIDWSEVTIGKEDEAEGLSASIAANGAKVDAIAGSGNGIGSDG